MASKPFPLAYEWQFPVAATNRRTQRKRLRAGELSLCEGVDGRYHGGLRKYYGFKRLTFTEDSCPTDTDWYRFQFLDTDDEVLDAWYGSIRIGSTSNWQNGFVVFWLDDSSSTYRLDWHYYDESSGYWTYANIIGAAIPGISGYTLSASSVIDVAPAGKFMYVAIEGDPPIVLWHNGSSFQCEEMGPGAAYDSAGDTGLAAPTDGGEGAGGHLDADSTYAYAYRYYDSDRGIYSAMSARLNDTIGSTGSRKVTLTNPDGDPDRAYDQGYDELHIYRTLSADIAGTSYVAGLLFKETEYDLDSGADCWPATVEVGTTRDDELVLGEAYDPNRDVSGIPPESGCVATFEGVTFMGDHEEPQFHWSQLHKHNPEVFPVSGHTYRWSSDDGLVQRFVKGGGNLYAFTENAAFRIAKAGAQIGIGRMHAGRTLVSKRAVTEMGRDVLAVTPLGVTIFDGATGNLSTQGAFDRIIFDDWSSTLDDLYVASDGPTGSTYIVNTNESVQEAAVVWHVTGAITSMSDMNFVAVVEGPHPEDGGETRAMFVTKDGAVVYPDSDASGSGTMLDIPSGTLHGTIALAASGRNLYSDDIPGTFDQRHVGAFIYWVSGANKGTRNQIVSEFGGTVTMDSSVNMAAGDAFEVSPVPFRVRAWPVPRFSNPYQDFGRRVVKGGLLQVTGLPASDPDADASYWTVGICRSFEDTPSYTTDVDMDENTADQSWYLNADGIDLEPYVKAVVSGATWELLGITINGTMTVSRNSKDSS